MRIRYGQPIKVTSLIGVCVETPVVFNAGPSGLGIASNGTFTVGGGASARMCQTISGHKYFVAEKYIVPAGSTFDLGSMRPSIYIPNVENTIYYNNIPYANNGFCCAVLTVNEGGAGNLHFRAAMERNVNQPVTACYRITIDLTAIGLDDLTAEQFFQRYNHRFPTIALGQETILDSKTGQVNYTTNNQTIICGVAGGDSEVYYGYNQKIQNGQFNDLYNAREDWWWDSAAGTAVIDGEALKWTYTTAKSGSFNLIYKAYDSLPPLPAGHKILYSYKIKTDHDGISLRHLFCYSDQYQDFTLHTDWNEYSAIMTASSNASYYQFQYRTGGPSVGDSVWFKDLYLIDLTEWFGAGNEPSTVQEFKAKFTQTYYGYNVTPIYLTQRQIQEEPYYHYNQMARDGVGTKTTNGITFTNNRDGSYSIQGTATADCVFAGFCYLGNSGVAQNHKFIMRGAPITSSYSTYYLRNDNRPNEGQVDLGSGQLFNWPNSYSWAFQLVVKSGTVITSPVTFWPQCFDLTEWYGAGNEPQSIAEFTKTFPKAHYPYGADKLLSRSIINQLGNQPTLSLNMVTCYNNEE